MYHNLAMFAFEFLGRGFSKDDTLLLSFCLEDEPGYNLNFYHAESRIASIGPRKNNASFLSLALT